MKLESGQKFVFRNSKNYAEFRKSKNSAEFKSPRPSDKISFSELSLFISSIPKSKE